jgi:cytochrome c oxidase cbb3-type subunit 3
MVTGWLLPLLFLPQQILDLPAVDTNPYTTPSDIEWGKRLYGGRCAGCHGPAGNGGKGANLAVPTLPRASNDLGLYKVIRYGIPETEMPISNMAPREIWQVAAFVRTLGSVAPEAARGDAVHGLQLVKTKGGCLRCHAVGTEGGILGPTLTDIGIRRGPAYLRRKLLDPAANLPDEFRMVDLTAPDGRKLSGMRLNEDTWSIQIRDLQGNLYSFWKKDLTDVRLQRRTPMPSYRTVFQGEELDDVVAYLAGLRGSE